MTMTNGNYIVCLNCREWFPHQGKMPELCAVCAGKPGPDERMYPVVHNGRDTHCLCPHCDTMLGKPGTLVRCAGDGGHCPRCHGPIGEPRHPRGWNKRTRQWMTNEGTQFRQQRQRRAA